MASKKSLRKSSNSTPTTHRSTLSMQKTEVMINVYDLLPPGRLSSILWALGTSLLHSGVVVNGKEYAYGGHDRRDMTGVYWTKPKSEPPGGTFRCEVLQGFTLASQDEIDAIITKASEAFQGTSYNILTKNCNHFTSYLCEMLTRRSGPGWLNRAASIGVALPCVVPREWIAPPDFETAGGDLLDEDDTDERSRMLRGKNHKRHSFEEWRTADQVTEDEWNSDVERRNGGSGKGKAPLRDTSGREVPASERAPLPKRKRSINGS